MTINTRTFASLVIDALFEHEETDDMINAIELAAEEHGLIVFRKPTPAEMADETWWGHEANIGPDDEMVMERTPECEDLVAPPVHLPEEVDA